MLVITRFVVIALVSLCLRASLAASGDGRPSCSALACPAEAASERGEARRRLGSSMLMLQRRLHQAGGVQEEDGPGQRLCDFAQNPWADYLQGPRQGAIVFKGSSGGQGLGNTMQGLAMAVRLAVLSRRDLIVDYALGSTQLDELVQPRRGGPEWRQRDVGPCSYSIRAFNFLAPEPATGAELLSAVRNRTRYPVVCHSGNSGPSSFTGLIDEVTEGAMPGGCPLSFLFDPAASEAANPGGFVLAGHLRLGDAHMKGADRATTDTGRPVINDPYFGLGTDDAAGRQFLACLQGFAAQLRADGAGAGKACIIRIMSDSEVAKQAARDVARAAPRGPDECEVRVAAGIAKHSTSLVSASDASFLLNDYFGMATADAVLLTDGDFGRSAASMGPLPRGRAFSFTHFLQAFADGHPGWLPAGWGDLREICASFHPSALAP